MEAIKCQQRALSSAEQGETVHTILSTLSSLQHQVGDFGSAAASHRLLITNAQAMGRGGGEVAGSWLYLAKHELGTWEEGAQEEEEGGAGRREPNWALAASYLNAIVSQVRSAPLLSLCLCLGESRT